MNIYIMIINAKEKIKWGREKESIKESRDFTSYR